MKIDIWSYKRWQDLTFHNNMSDEVSRINLSGKFFFGRVLFERKFFEFFSAISGGDVETTGLAIYRFPFLIGFKSDGNWFKTSPILTVKKEKDKLIFLAFSGKEYVVKRKNLKDILNTSQLAKFWIKYETKYIILKQNDTDSSESSSETDLSKETKKEERKNVLRMTKKEKVKKLMDLPVYRRLEEEDIHHKMETFRILRDQEYKYWIKGGEVLDSDFDDASRVASLSKSQEYKVVSPDLQYMIENTEKSSQEESPEENSEDS
jgi:hypothetical protein